MTPKPRAEGTVIANDPCGCKMNGFNDKMGWHMEIAYCPLHGAANELLQFVKDIRPFLGYDPEATLHKRADELITAATKEDK